MSIHRPIFISMNFDTFCCNNQDFTRTYSISLHQTAFSLYYSIRWSCTLSSRRACGYNFCTEVIDIEKEGNERPDLTRRRVLRACASIILRTEPSLIKNY